MKWKITYYSDAVAEGIAAWPKKLKAKYLFIADLIEEHGANLGKPHTDSLGDGLFEIRAKAQEGIGRAFFCTVKGREVVVLHEFIKKTQKTPKKELDIARQRLEEVKA